MSGVHQPLLENAFSRTTLTSHLAFQYKSGINPVYNIRKKYINSIQEIIFFVIARPY